jgi:hypothetical protein
LALERILGKLKYDGSVTGFALLTNNGQPFLSFSLPEDLLPQIHGALKIHASSLKLVNVMTKQGTLILARVDPNWILAVHFSEESLGSALQKTKAVVEMLGQIELPPPPSNIETKIVPETSEGLPEDLGPEIDKMKADLAAEGTTISVVEAGPVVVKHGCIVHRGPTYADAVTLSSPLNRLLKEKLAKFAVDVLLLADEKRTVFKISQALGKSVEQVIDAVTWCVSERILTVECPEEQEAGVAAIVEYPLFEGDLKKAKKEHQAVLMLCNGTRTIQDIATELNIPYFKALQSIVPYRGKTVRLVGKDKAVE